MIKQLYGSFIMLLFTIPFVGVMAQDMPQDEQPTICTMEYAPVCGVDGETYGNDCMARAAGVAIDYDGECNEIGKDSDNGSDNGFEDGSDSDDQIPDEDEGFFCPEYYQPVCGEVEKCDDSGCETVRETFSNECFANGNNATIIAQGACEDLDDQSDDGKSDDGQSDEANDDQSDDGQTDDSETGDNQDDIDTVLTEAENASLEMLVSWASGQGITKYSDTTAFMPNESVTRQQAAKMLLVVLGDRVEGGVNDPIGGVPGGGLEETQRCQFADLDRIDSSLLPRVEKACEAGLFQGSPDNMFMPDRALLQIDLMTVLERTVEYLPPIGTLIASNDLRIDPSDPDAYMAVSREEFLRVLWVVSSIQENIDEEFASAQEALTSAQALRDEQGSQTYTLVQQRTCFCPEEYRRPMRYGVVDGSVVRDSAVYHDSDEPLAEDFEPGLLTIDEAFAKIQNAIDTNVASLDVEYDEAYGYPTTISIDINVMMADEEEYYTFTLVE